MERGGGCVGLMDTLCRGREGGRWASPRLGETTVAEERERRGREGGRDAGEAARIFMKTPSVFSLSRRGDTLLVCRGETEGGRRRERKQDEAQPILPLIFRRSRGIYTEEETLTQI
ncbi:hypothetical protein PBY51_019798 [Eleginops maclovinus]|uniref:Uncharacterized protein n=1 Tax=Eleginops maclovinus TaxID=56733 RepID=A0AAN7XL77_ELEMC|nr:hypothetical protein PBY51_019798 [Eleginops maclovinus]